MNHTINSKRSKVKMAHIIDSLGLGGTQRQLTALVKAFPKERYQIEIISFSENQRDYERELTEAGIPVTFIHQSSRWSWSAFWKLYRKLGKIKPDIVHCWLFTAGLYGRLAAFFSHVPHTILAMRNPMDDMPPHYRFVDSLLSHITSCITVNAECIRPQVIKKMRVPSRKIRTIYNGIDLNRFSTGYQNGRYRREWHIPPDGRLVMMTARMAEQKDHDTFVDAARRVASIFPNAYFILAGDGPLRRRLEKRITELDLRRQFRVLGARTDAWEITQSVDVCVLSTHYEGCSNVIMEAMAAGKPVVATHAGGNSELIANGETGFLVPHADSRSLADRITELLNDEDKMNRMGTCGRRRIHEKFTIQQTVEKTEKLYQDLLKNRFGAKQC